MNKYTIIAQWGFFALSNSTYIRNNILFLAHISNTRKFSTTIPLSMDTSDDNFGEGSSKNPNLGRDKGKKRAIEELDVYEYESEHEKRKVKFASENETRTEKLHREKDEKVIMEKLIKDSEIKSQENVLELQTKFDNFINYFYNYITPESIEKLKKLRQDFEEAREQQYEKKSWLDKIGELQYRSNMRNSRSNQIEASIFQLLKDNPTLDPTLIEEIKEGNRIHREENKKLISMINEQNQKVWEKEGMPGELKKIKSSDIDDYLDPTLDMPGYTDSDD